MGSGRQAQPEGLVAAGEHQGRQAPPARGAGHGQGRGAGRDGDPNPRHGGRTLTDGEGAEHAAGALGAATPGEVAGQLPQEDRGAGVGICGHGPGIPGTRRLVGALHRQGGHGAAHALPLRHGIGQVRELPGGLRMRRLRMGNGGLTGGVEEKPQVGGAAAVHASRYAREIEAGHRRWQTFLNKVPLAVIGITRTGLISYVNPFFERLSGYRSHELVGQPATRLVSEADAAELENRLRVAAETGPRPHSQWTLLCRPGERRQLLFSSVRQESPEGTYEGLLTIGEDITDRLRAERELSATRREMERLMRANMLGELASALAHELYQPLAAILSNAQAAQRMLGSEALQPQDLAEILEDSVRDDRRAGNVIARMRSMVRKGEVRREPVDLNTAVRAALDLMHSELDTQDVRVVLSLADDLPLVFASQVDIQQVVMNLVMNAARAVKGLSEDERLVAIETLRTDRHIRLSVEDSGTGVQKEIADSMFEPFFTTKSVGIGMGLAICRRLVDAHGGRIWVENRDKGGARFTVELPLTEAVQTSDD